MPRLTLCLGLSIMVAITAPVAAEDARYQAIDALGELNGLALQCKYVDQVRRMKAAVVDNAPKERSFGLAFDQATNRAFLEFNRAGGSCPGPDPMARRVDAAIEHLRSVFAAP